MEFEAGAPLDRFSQIVAGQDWVASPLGPPEQWSPSLRTTAEILLRSQAQIILFWGPEFVAIYNAAYMPTIGDKHPRALGRPARENWAELWDDLEPLLEGVRRSGQAFSAKDRPFYLERHGYGETVYFDVSYSAVPEADGSVGGVLCIVSETTERVLAQRRLAESETRFRALVNASSDVIYRMGPDWSEMLALDGRGLLADTAAPRQGWLDTYILPGDQDMIRNATRDAIQAMVPFQLEHRVIQKDGSIGWTSSRAVPILDDAGQVIEWFGAASDVTVRRQASEHLQLVVHELNHRVKNSLAMVQAIAAQTFRNIADPEATHDAQARFAARLGALAQANDLLTGERWTGASLAAAIGLAIEPFRRDLDCFTLDGPEIQISSKTALALTLAFHELAANAVKYGALSDDRGRIAIAWSRYDGDDGPRVRLEWREADGPPVTLPQQRGFGSRLIERGLAGELNGTVELRFPPDGVRCLIDAPLPTEADD